MEGQPLKVMFQISKMHGIWPRNLNNMRSASHFVQVVIVLCFYCPISFGSSLHLIHTISSGSKYLIADLVADGVIMTSGMGMYLMIITFIRSGEKIIRVLQRIMNFEKFGEPENIGELNKNLNYFLIGSWFYSFTGCAFFVIFGLSNKQDCEELAIEHGLDSNCGFMAPVWMPFYIKTGTSYWIYLTVQFVTCCAICNIAVVIMSSVFSIVELFVRKVDHFNLIVGQIFKSDSGEDASEYFKHCIQYHQELLETADEINDAFGLIFLMNLFYASTVIGLIGYQCMIELQPKNVMHFIGWIIALFGPCLAGQRLINVSEKIPIQIYSTEWYNQNVKLQKDIILPIMRSNKGMALKPQGFGDMSMMTFSSVIQTAYSYLTMISQTTDFTSEDPIETHFNQTSY